MQGDLSPPLAGSCNEFQDEGLGSHASFEGFDPPESNFWRLPNDWFDIMASFTSWAEHKVVEYILRHTWGYQEYDVSKLITMDEFMHGRKRRDGSRLDAGCGMAENSIKKGIRDAVLHGFLVVEEDHSDLGRIKKFYRPRMRRTHSDDGMHTASPRRSTESTSAAAPATLQAQQPYVRAHTAHQGQTLPAGGQELTLKGQPVIPRSQSMTPRDQHLHPQGQELIRSTAAADPRTGETPPVLHLRKDTGRQQPRVAAHATTGAGDPTGTGTVQDQDTPAFSAAELVQLLVAEGVTASKARSLVHAVPAERILRQIQWLDGRRYQNRAATLIAAIERDYSAPAVPRAAAEGAPFDSDKFFRGTYTLCPACACRPCVCEAPAAARHEVLR